jgi:predicted deacylase
MQTGVPSPQPPAVPCFEVRIAAPKIDDWLAGNTGITGFTTRESGRPGPHVALVALTHGNEIAGAIVLEQLLSGGLRPLRGRLSFGFANLAAFARFDPRQPTASRFVDEDMNRIWDAAVLDGPRRSSELDRARQMRPLIDQVDVLLDLHTMLWPSEPLMLCGSSPKGRELALAIGQPSLIVADHGHASGPRLIDYQPFVDPARGSSGVLVESGQHWEEAAIDMTLETVAGLLRHTGTIETFDGLPPPRPAPSPRFAEVTNVVTASTANFAFVQPFRGGEVIARRNTLIALDGANEIRTPYDECLLVMPSLRPSRGHTAVRLARRASIA